MNYFKTGDDNNKRNACASSFTISDELRIRYHSIINHANLEGQDKTVCCVCLEDSGTDKDELVYCDLCQNCVHQICYGSELYDNVPSGNWFCMRCKYLLDNNLNADNVKCFLCPEIKGMLKRVNCSKWTHIECINWTPEIYFLDCYREKGCIEGLNIERYTELICFICRKKEGSCLQCDFRNCCESFHVRCAIEKCLIEYPDKMNKRKIRGYIPVFCATHKRFYEELNPAMRKEFYNEALEQIEQYEKKRKLLGKWVYSNDKDESDEEEYSTRDSKKSQPSTILQKDFHTMLKNNPKVKARILNQTPLNTKEFFEKEKRTKYLNLNFL